MQRIFLLAVCITHSILVASQSLGSGAVTYTDYIGEYYVNLSGDLEIEYVFRDNQPEIKLRWKWVKVNTVQYDGVEYNAVNNQLRESLFDNKSESFWGNVTVLDQAPTVTGLQEFTQDIYAGQVYTSFKFDVNLDRWNDMSSANKSEAKKQWQSKSFPSRITLNSIKGSVVEDIFRAIKNHVKDQAKKKAEIEKVKQEFDRLQSSFDSTQQYIENNANGLATLNKYYLKASNLEKESKNIDQATSYKAEKLKEQIKAQIDQLKASINKPSFETESNAQETKSESTVSNKESIYQKRERAAAEVERQRIAHNNSYQKKADAIVEQGERRVQVMQNTLDTWNSSMDMITQQMVKNAEIEDRKLEQARKERERKQRIEQEAYERRRKANELERRKREARRDRQDLFMSKLKDVKTPLNSNNSTLYVIMISRISYNEIKIVPTVLHKNANGQFPYKQDVLKELYKNRVRYKLVAFDHFFDEAAFKKALNQIKTDASSSDVIYTQLETYETKMYKEKPTREKEKKSFWDN
ncbi:MAG: hypothetical protein WBG46_05195 [Nonlabens sp.]